MAYRTRTEDGALRIRLGALLSAALLAAAGGCAVAAAREDPGEAGEQGAEEADPGLMDEVRRLYESAKEKGERVPRNVSDWVREDIGAIGDWEYLVLPAGGPGGGSLQERLNELGRDRWECFWIEPREEGPVLYLKRPSRTYLRHIPLSDLLRILPTGGAAE